MTKILLLRMIDSSLTFSEMSLKSLPSTPCLHTEVTCFSTQAWEGMKGRGDQTVSILSTPTLFLPLGRLCRNPLFVIASDRRERGNLLSLEAL